MLLIRVRARPRESVLGPDEVDGVGRPAQPLAHVHDFGLQKSTQSRI